MEIQQFSTFKNYSNAVYRLTYSRRACLCFQWCQQQPESRSDRTGKLDTRAAYGMHGREMMAWLTHLQHIRDKNVIFVGILDEYTDDYGRKQYALQIEGSKTGKRITGHRGRNDYNDGLGGDNGSYRKLSFAMLSINGAILQKRIVLVRLDTLEEPHLGKLIEKMGNGGNTERKLSFVNPNEQILAEGTENAESK